MNGVTLDNLRFLPNPCTPQSVRGTDTTFLINMKADHRNRGTDHVLTLSNGWSKKWFLLSTILNSNIACTGSDDFLSKCTTTYSFDLTQKTLFFYSHSYIQKKKKTDQIFQFPNKIQSVLFRFPNSPSTF